MRFLGWGVRGYGRYDKFFKYWKICDVKRVDFFSVKDRIKVNG